MFLMPYAVKLGKVKAAFGSKDEALFNEIKKSEIYNCYASQDGNYPVNVETATRQVLFGEQQDESFPIAYGYGLFAIVAYFGENLAKEGDVFKFGSIIDNIDRKIASYNLSFKIEELASPIYQFDIPPNNDFPFIGGITKERLQSIQLALNLIKITPEQLVWRNEAYDQDLESISILRRGVNHCLSNDLDWISFVH